MLAHQRQEHLLARAAADGAVRVVDVAAGTTTHLCALELAARGRSDLTVVTNSAPVAEAFGSAPGDRPEVVLTGGSLTPSRALVGPLAVAALATLRVDVLLLGVHGLDADAGLTTKEAR